MTGFTAQGSMFEGLYERILKPEGEFRDALKAAGYDRADPRPEYPMDVWVACLDVTAKHRFPAVPRHEAWRSIGALFIEGFLETLVGKLIGAALPFLSPRTFLTRGPRFITTGIPDLVVQVEWTGPTSARLTMNGPHPGSAHVLAGVLEVMLRRFKVTPTISSEGDQGPISHLTVSWVE